MQIIDRKTVAIPGPVGDVTPEALAALAQTETYRDQSVQARDAAEMFAAGTSALQDAAIATQVGDPDSETREALDHVYERGISVLSMGAVGDGITDDSAAIRSTIAAASTFGAQVWFPKRTYAISRVNAGTAYAIGIPAGVSLVGEGATLKLASGQLDYTSMLQALGTGVTVRGLTLDGNKAGQSNESDHRRHGVFISDATDVSIIDCRIKDCAGDGILIYHGGERTTIRGSVITGCKRSGIAIVGEAHETSIENNRIYGNVATPIDGEVEGTFARDVHIIGNHLEAVPGEYALTCGSVVTEHRCPRWVIEGNTIVGGVTLLRSSKTRFVGNTVRTTAGTIPALIISITDQTLVQGNEIEAFARGIVGLHTLGVSPSNVSIIANDIRSGGIGIELDGVKDAQVAHNRLLGAGVGNGIVLTATNSSVTDVDVMFNHVRDYNSVGVAVSASGANTITGMTIAGQKFRDGQTTPTMIIGVRFSGVGTNYSNIRHADNMSGTGVTTPMSDSTTSGPVPLSQSFYNKVPITKPAAPGTAAGSDAAVINAIVTALRNLGLVT